MGSPCVPETIATTRHRHDVLRPDDRVVRNVQQAQAVRDLGRRQHAAAQERHLAVQLGRNVQDLLQTVDRTRETGDDDAVLGAVEDLLEARHYRPLARCVTRPVDVGRIRQQQQHAPLAVAGQRV